MRRCKRRAPPHAVESQPKENPGINWIPAHDSSEGRAVQRNRAVMGSNPVQVWIFQKEAYLITLTRLSK